MTFRNRALLDICHEAPCLLLPSQHQCAGPSEPAHSDMIRHGRGEHHKSHDCFAVPGCHNAHLAFTRANLGKDGYHAAWTEAMERYILWQWVTGKVRLADITQRPKESTMEAPHCRICNHSHWAREPHILPADAPAEKRSARPNTSADEAKGRKAGNARRDSSADCSSSRFTARAGGTPVKELMGGTSSLNGWPGSQGTSRARERNAGRTVDVTARRDGKNTSREGRDVLKAKATSNDRDHLKAQPATANPGKTAGAKGTAEKPPPGKRKTAPKGKKHG